MTFFILPFKIGENSLKFANFKVQNEECHYYEHKQSLIVMFKQSLTSKQKFK
jgi:hypothetical protein